MDILSGDISIMVLRREIKTDPGDISLDGQTLKVLAELDGMKNLGLVARTLGMDMIELKVAVSKLIEFQLIRPVEGSVSMLGREFFDFLRNQLSIITGPIAQVMLEDAVYEIGCEEEKIPKNRVAELIELLSRQIPDETQRTAFIQMTMERIKGVESY